jgi:SNF2 family DNA or RNA helicase
MGWICGHCSFTNRGNVSRCRVCNIKNNGHHSNEKEERACPQCTLLNPVRSKSCEACEYVFTLQDEQQLTTAPVSSSFVPSTSNSSSSPLFSSNSTTQNKKDEEDDGSDCEEKMFFELVLERIDEFVETLIDEEKQQIIYKCKFDGRICGTKSIMCAYITRRHKSAVLNQLKSLSTNQSDEKMAWKLAILDYEEVTETTAGQGLKQQQKNRHEISSENTLTESRRRASVRSASLPTATNRSSSSNRSLLQSKSEQKKKREYAPLPPSSYFRNRSNPTASSSGKTHFSDLNLTEEDKETRLKKLLTKSDQIVSKLAHLIPTSTPKVAMKESSANATSVSSPTVSSTGESGSTSSSSNIQSTSCSSPVRAPAEYPLLVGCSLRNYQSAGVEWLCSLHDAGLSGILADEMGLGLLGFPSLDLSHSHFGRENSPGDNILQLLSSPLRQLWSSSCCDAIVSAVVLEI